MTTSLYMPDVKVEIAFNAGVNTAAASRTWTDVSAYVELHEGISITYGRGDERSEADPNQLTLTLDNKDGRFTAGRAASPYYPNVKIGRPIRVTATPPGGTASVRFVGFVDEWPVEWDGTDQYAKAAISATSRLARLGAQVELQTRLVEEVLATAPDYYWTLGDPAGSTRGQEHLERATLRVVTKSQQPITFGNATGPPTDGLTAAQWGAQPIGGDHSYLEASELTPPTTALTLSAFFLTPSSTTLGDAWRLYTTGSDSPAIIVDWLGSGSEVCRVDIGGVSTGSMITGVNFRDGTTRHLAVTMAESGSDVAVTVHVDGVQVATGTAVGTSLPDVTRLQVRGFRGEPDTVAAHVALHLRALAAAEVAEIAGAGFSGHVESAGARIERYARLAGVPAAEVSAEAGSVADVADLDTGGITALEAMRKVEATEDGVLFDARDGTLTFHDRDRRYSQASAFTLDATAQQVEGGLAPKLDRSALLNDVTAATIDGTTTARAVNQTSVDDYGPARESLELATTDAAEPLQAASWRVNTYAEPRARVPALAVNVTPLSGALQASLLAATVGTRFTVSNLPSQADATSKSFVVEGYVERIGPESYELAFNVSPAELWDVWTIEDPVLGQYDAYPIAY